jgi:predicted XRE-type DNA-binding protein
MVSKPSDSIDNRRTRDNKGEKHPVSTLPQEDVNEIRSLVNQGFTQKSVAALFGVSRSCISSIIRGKAWGLKSV